MSVVAAAWLGWTIFAYRHGMETIDTLWYHLPFAARFVQDHNIRHLQYFDGDAITVFYPAITAPAPSARPAPPSVPGGSGSPRHATPDPAQRRSRSP